MLSGGILLWFMSPQGNRISYCVNIVCNILVWKLFCTLYFIPFLLCHSWYWSTLCVLLLT